MWATLAFSAAVLLVSQPAPAGGPDPSPVRRAVARALPPIERSVQEYPAHRDCFSCHHQAVPALALSLARARGFPVATDAIDAIREVTLSDLEGAREAYRAGKGQPGGVTRAGYALWTLALTGAPEGDPADAVAGFLAGKDDADGAWKTSSNRPPSEASPFTTTLVALRGLEAFGPRDADARRQRAREWLERARPKPGDAEDHAFRLMGLRLAGAAAARVREAADALIALQRQDGGWGQVDGRPSDAYATGSALYAIHTAGDVPVDAPAYRRGAAFLVATQREDGTWHVASRSKAFQPYFESGFPHGKDQFLSIAASAWAAAALALACPDSHSPSH
jgi:hypothetical protein